MGNYMSYGTLIPKGIFFGITELFRKTELTEEEKRRVLDGEVNIDKIVEGIKKNKYKNIIVICGAGLSTAAGIPDFRSSKGFYANVEKYKLSSPMDIFSISFYKENPKPFLELAKDLLQYEGKFFPTYSHYFLNFLHEKNLLLRVWTQNVDGLELLAGLPPTKIVEAHGHVRTCHCIKCGKGHTVDWFKEKLESDKLPYCKFCRTKNLVKPDVTFFGEALPKRFFSLFMSDFRKADLMLVIGTSLQVFPFAGLVDRVGLSVPRVLFNMETVGPFHREKSEGNNYRDVVVLGPCDETLKKFVGDCGWKLEVPQLEKKKKNPDLMKVLGVIKKKDDDEEEEDEGEEV